MHPCVSHVRSKSLAVSSPLQLMKETVAAHGFTKGGLYSGFLPSLCGLGVYCGVTYGGVLALRSVP
jgi:hypothetical protein